ncbi:MAG: ice-binding family protein [Sphingobacteriaceae bacterium]|nr:ice-binding family protein [Sphingobacteriaceae bacterium]
MKTLLKFLISAAVMLLISQSNFAQAPTLGTAANFVLFSSNGAVSHTGLSQITGNVGTNSGSSTNFGNVNGNMHDQNPASAQAATDLLTAYNQIAAVTANYFVASPLGNGDTLTAGVYSLGAASTLNGMLTLDAQNIDTAVFIIRVMGSLSSAANTKVNLINGAQACNVYWQIEGLLSIASGTVLRGTFIVNNAAITMSTNDTIEGRLLTTTGGLTVDNIMAYTPIGCGSPVLTGPNVPALGTAGCFGVFSANGQVINAGVSFITGDVGTQVGSVTGFDSLNVTGKIHLVQDTTTAAAAAALGNAYTGLNTITHDIQLMAPAAFGNGLVLTPHTYLLNAMTVFTDSLYLNAMGDSNAVFVIKINGALSTSTYSKVILINQARSKNVYWVVNGAVEINDYSQFKGTVIANNGAVDAKIGVQVQGRLMTTVGAINTAAVNVVSPITCLASTPGVTIITEPLSLQRCAGDTALFVVKATGSNLSYQWYRNNVALINGGAISGANKDSLYIIPATLANAGSYTVIVSGTAAADTSQVAMLTVTTATQITTEPSSKTVCAGDSAVFTVIAQGSGLTYRWYRGNTALINSFFITGADSSSITFLSPAQGNVDSNYYVVVTGLCGVADTSNRVSLRLNAVPLVLTEPQSQTKCIGDTVRFSITTTIPANIRWYKGNTLLSNGANVVGADSTVLSLFALNAGDAATNYYAIVSGVCGVSDTSNLAALTINPLTNITTEPVSATLCEGQTLNLSVVAAGTSLTYQWYKGNVAMANAAGISGVTTASLSITAVTLAAAANYYVVVTGTCGKDTSALASVQVNTGTDITTQPLSQNVCIGQPTSFSVVALGNSLTYQWRKGNVVLVNGGSISGATSSTLTISAVNLADIATNYNVIVNSICGAPDTSDFAILVVNTLNEITTEPIAQTVCAGQMVNLSVIAQGAGLTYQWRIGSTNLTNGGLISGATTATLTISAATLANAASNYNVIVSGSCGSPDTSVSVAVVVNSSPAITTQPLAQTLCVGANATFTVVATGTALTYQWRKGLVNLTNTGNISGANTATLTLTGVSLTDAAADYNVLISGTCTPALASANVALQVNSLVAITTAPLATQTVCAGSSVSFAVVATGTGLTYQWRRGTTNLTNTGNVTGATSAVLTLNPVVAGDAATNYNVVIVGTCAPQQISANAALVVNALTAITTQPMNMTACEGDMVSFSSVSVGTALSYQWFKGGVALSNAGNISGSNTNTLVINPVTIADIATNYQLVVTGSCLPAVSSNLVGLSVGLPHEIVTQPSDTITNIGGSASFTVVDNGQGLTYQWRRGSTNVVEGGNISGSQSATLQFSPATVADNGMNYNVVISGPCAADVRSINVALLVTQPLSVEEWLAKETPVVFYPNPFNTELNAMIQSSSSLTEADVQLYNSLGVLVMQSSLTTEQGMREQMNLPAGIYHYRVVSNGQLIQSGKLVSIQ